MLGIKRTKSRTDAVGWWSELQGILWERNPCDFAEHRFVFSVAQVEGLAGSIYASWWCIRFFHIIWCLALRPHMICSFAPLTVQLRFRFRLSSVRDFFLFSKVCYRTSIGELSCLSQGCHPRFFPGKLWSWLPLPQHHCSTAAGQNWWSVTQWSVIMILILIVRTSELLTTKQFKVRNWKWKRNKSLSLATNSTPSFVHAFGTLSCGGPCAIHRGQCPPVKETMDMFWLDIHSVQHKLEDVTSHVTSHLRWFILEEKENHWASRKLLRQEDMDIDIYISGFVCKLFSAESSTRFANGNVTNFFESTDTKVVAWWD